MLFLASPRGCGRSSRSRSRSLALLGVVAHVRASARGAGGLPRRSPARSARSLWLALPAPRPAQLRRAWRMTRLRASRALFWIVARAPLARATAAARRRRVRASPAGSWSGRSWLALVVLRDTSPWLLLAARGARLGRRHRGVLRRPALRQAQARPRRSAPARRGRASTARMAGVVVYGARALRGSPTHATPLTPIFVPALRLPAIAAMLVLTARERRGRPVRVVDEARRGR